MRCNCFVTIFVAFCFFTFCNLAAQEPNKFSRFSIKLGARDVNKEPEYYSQSDISFVRPTPAVCLEANYNIYCIFEIGAYLNYSSLGHRVPLKKDSTGLYTLIYKDDIVRTTSSSNNYFLSSNTFFYGLTANVQLLPLFIHSRNLRLDIYVTAKLGTVSARWQTFNGVDFDYEWNKPSIEYGIGLGFAYYYTRYFGVFTEFSLGRYYNCLLYTSDAADE